MNKFAHGTKDRKQTVTHLYLLWSEYWLRTMTKLLVFESMSKSKRKPGKRKDRIVIRWRPSIRVRRLKKS
jgi:hypothetical protein